eukprot:403376303
MNDDLYDKAKGYSKFQQEQSIDQEDTMRGSSSQAKSTDDDIQTEDDAPSNNKHRVSHDSESETDSDHEGHNGGGCSSCEDDHDVEKNGGGKKKKNKKRKGKKEDQPVEDDRIDIRLTITQGSFLPAMALIENKLLDPDTFIVDPNIQAKIIHYVGHFGNVKALRSLIEVQGADSNVQDSYKLNLAHYAAREGHAQVLACQGIATSPIMSDQRDRSSYLTMINMLGENNWSYTMLLYLIHEKEAQPLIVQVCMKNILAFQDLQRLGLIFRLYKDHLSIAVLNQIEIARNSMIPINQQLVKKMMVNYILTNNVKDSSNLVKKDMIYYQELLGFIWNKSAMLIMPCIYLFASMFYFIALLTNNNLSLMTLFNMDNVSVLAILGFWLLGFISMLKFQITEPGNVHKLSIDNPDNVVHKLCDEFETKSKATDFNEVCFICLQYQQGHINHCKKCEVCVQGYQYHSRAFNKCVGRDNVLSFVYFYLFNLIALLLFISNFISNKQETARLQSSNFLLQMIEIHARPLLEQRFGFAIPLITAQILVGNILEVLLHFVVAAQHNITIHEMQNSFEYKKVFELQKSAFTERPPQYGWPKISLFKAIGNTVKFFVGIDVLNGGQNQRVIKGGQTNGYNQALQQSGMIEMTDFRRNTDEPGGNLSFDSQE